MFKLRPKAVIGKKSYEHFIFNQPDLFCMEHGDVGKDQASQYFEVSFSSSKGGSGQVQVMIEPISVPQLPPMWIIYFHNVTDEINLSNAYKQEAQEKEKANQAIFKIQDDLKEYSEMAMKDQMTGLGNFRYFEKEVVNLLNESLKKNFPLGLIIIDVDKFKVFNDTYGHQQGDEVLRYVAKTLASTVRQFDVVARYGGEEFVVVLPNCMPGAINIVCEKLRAAIEAVKVPYLKQPGDVLSVTISLGGITIDPNVLAASGTTTYKPMLEVADKNLYEAKHSGRNRFVVSIWTPDKQH